VADIKSEDLRHRWHPYSSVADLEEAGPLVIEGASGVRVTDSDGKTYIDGHAGLWLVNVGYGRASIAEAAYKQMQRLAWFPSFGRHSNGPAIELSNRLAGLLEPEGMTHFFYSDSGSEANESALKIVRQYWKARGQAQRTKFISLENAYHGVTIGALSVAGMTVNRRAFEPLLGGVRHAVSPNWYRMGLTPENCRKAAVSDIERIIAFEGADTIAAFIAEPVQGAGGVVIPPEGYLQDVAKLLRRNDILFIADEVITGFGRTGSWFGSRHFGVKPDIMTFAKGITSGYLPLGATAVTDRVYEAFRGGAEFRHGNTYSGHPTVAAVAMENLRIVEEEDLPGRAAKAGAHLLQRLRGLEGHPSVGNVNGVGLLGRCELVADKGSREPIPAAVMVQVMKRILEAGVILRASGNVITFSPPLIIEDEDLDRIVDAVEEALTEVADRALAV